MSRGLNVLRVTDDGGLESLGIVQQLGDIRRTVRIGEFMYSISDQQVRVRLIDDPMIELASVDLPH